MQDELLQRADETDAVNLVTTLKEQQFRGFGAARQVCRWHAVECSASVPLLSPL
jgi:hypothetical protein